MAMTISQQIRQKHRSHGRYAQVNPCCVCGKSAGENYNSHPDTDGSINDELICLCRKCFDRLRGLPGPEAVKVAFAKGS